MTTKGEQSIDAPLEALSLALKRNLMIDKREALQIIAAEAAQEN